MRNLIKTFVATLVVALTCSACAAVPADTETIRVGSARETATIEQTVPTPTETETEDVVEVATRPAADSAVESTVETIVPTSTDTPAATTNIIDDIINQRNAEIAGSSASAYTSVPDASADAVIDVSDYGFNNTTAYNFVKAMTTGSTFTTENKTVSFPYEGRWGITASAVGTTVNLKAYSNLGYNPTIASVSLVGATTNNLNGSINYTSDYSLNLTPGAYRVKTTFVVNGYEITNEVGIYVDNDEVWLCEYTFESAVDVSTSISRFNNLLANAGYNTSNTLNYSSVTFNGVDYNTAEWANVASEIITDEAWSDGYKVMIIHDYICDNIAYDDYANNILGTPRAYMYNDFSGTYSAWNTGVGVCMDVSKIFMIMCRYNNIPCIACADDTHMWNAVCINGIWYEIDLTKDMYKRVTTSNMNNITIRGTASYTPVYFSTEINEVRNH